AMMHPAVPAGRDARRLGLAVIDHPTAPAAALAVVAVAALVLADELALPPRPQARAECRPVPPGEELQKESFHRTGACRGFARSRIAHRPDWGTQSATGPAARG